MKSPMDIQASVCCSMLAAAHMILVLVPSCRATTSQTMTTTAVPTLFSPHSSTTTASPYNFSCYGCFGVVGEVTQCGESLRSEEDKAAADIVPCNTVCTKAVTYMMDMKIMVRRNCSRSCDPGCEVKGGAGTCWYCCHGDLCNGADRINIGPSHTQVLLVLGAALIYPMLT